jgi:hypothetical protein
MQATVHHPRRNDSVARAFDLPMKVCSEVHKFAAVFVLLLLRSS